LQDVIDPNDPKEAASRHFMRSKIGLHILDHKKVFLLKVKSVKYR